jgi:hypothetical protein
MSPTTHGACVSGDDLSVPRSRIVIASMIGTTIEFYDFYIYATAAVSVFPLLFFPKSDSGASLLASMSTFGVAFVARSVGSVGIYLTTLSVLTFIAIWLSRETRHTSLESFPDAVVTVGVETSSP